MKRLATFSAAVVGLAGTVLAHPLAPSLLSVEELSPERVAVTWKTPLEGVPGAATRPVLPERCERTSEPVVTREATALVQQWTVACGESLVGAGIAVEDVAASKADVLLRVKLADGRSFRSVLTPETPSFTVPERESRWSVFEGYLALGVEHIVTGFDHLLFVFGLLLLVSGRRLLWTVTAFTVGHSVTLSLAVLGFVNVPPGPVEAAIALTILALAAELLRDPEWPGLMRRHPWGTAGAFGLLHGLGFAGALSAVGLPAEEIPLALFSFNVGIELGQIAFIVVVLAVRALLRPVRLAWLLERAPVPAYVIGSLAAFWFLERL